MPPRKVYYETLQTFSWPNMDRDESYRALSRMKDERLDDDETDENWVRESEVRKRIEKAEKEARMDYRDGLIRRLTSCDGITSEDIADPFELSASRVRQIARGD